MPAIIQPSFSAGEVAPRVQARVDLTKRTVAVARAINGLVSVTGSLDKRPGTEFIDTTYNNDPGRLIPFVYNKDQTYVLVFTDSRLEVYRDGVQRDSLASPFAEADLFDIRYAQYGDQMTLVHPDYAPRELTRASDTSWSFSRISFTPDQTWPDDVRTVENQSEKRWAVDSITKANPGVVTTSAAHGLSDNDIVMFQANINMTELQRGTFKISVDTATTFKLLDPEDGANYSTVGFDTYTSGGYVFEAPRVRNYVVTAVNGQTGEESIVGRGNVTDDVSSVSSATPAVVVTTGGHGLMTGDEVTFGGGQKAWGGMSKAIEASQRHCDSTDSRP